MFRDYQPEQDFLLPPSPRDWLPEGHLAWFISDTVDQLDLGPILSAYRARGKGNLAYHPALLLKILIYAYSTGVFSSRKIARQIEDSIAFRVLAGGESPNHRTICRFRETHLEHFEDLFVQVVQIAAASGLVKMGTLAIDGSKVKANASKHKAMSYERMLEEEEKLRGEIRRLARAAAQQDEVEDGEFGAEFRGDELPEELQRRKSRLKKIKEARERLEARKAEEAKKAQGEGDSTLKTPKKPRAGKKGPGRPRIHPPGQPKPKDQENFTDPDSRIMKDGSGAFRQCYNGQVAVDEGAQIIVGAEVTQCAADAHQLIPMIEQSSENAGKEPDVVLADSGYKSESNFEQLEEREIHGLIPLGREGKESKKCNQDLQATARMKRRMAGKRGRKRYKKRKHIVEPVFGWIKSVLGFRSFSVRGKNKVDGEWNLVCLALNLRRMNHTIAW